jgi:hypothetical protein
MISFRHQGYIKLIDWARPHGIKGYRPRFTGGDMRRNKYPQKAGKAM